MNKDKKKKNSFIQYIDILLFFVFALIVALFAAFGAFEKIDFRIYDSLLHLKKEIPAYEKIAYAEIDDASINDLGSWPWTRDIIAECLIRFKEMGAERAVFDIEYLSPSKKSFDEDMEDFIKERIKEAAENTIATAEQFASSVQSGRRNAELKNEFISEIQTNINSIGIYFENGIRNYDDEFAKALQFFGNSWLTVNNRDVEIPQNETDYVKNHLMLNNVSDPNNYIEKSNGRNGIMQNDKRNFGFTPALPLLIQHAAGMGFTNVNIDSDGTRRRIELLYKYGDKYAGQLVFAPFLQYVDAQSLERKKNSLVVKGALMPGKTEREDIKIPLDRNGTMLINWLHKDFGDSFRHIFLGQVYNLKTTENFIYDDLYNLVNTASNFSELTSLPFFEQASTLLSEFESVFQDRDILLSFCTGYTEEEGVVSAITDEMYDSYFSKRATLFDSLLKFRKSMHEQSLFEAILSLDISDDARNQFWSSFAGAFSVEDIAQNLNPEDFTSEEDFYYENQDYFGLLTTLYYDVDSYNSIYNTIAPVAKDAFLIVGETASSTTDMGANPFFNRFANVGTHANVLNTIMQKDFITPVWWVYGFLITVLITGIFILLLHTAENATQNIVNGIVFAFSIIIPSLMLPIFSMYIPLMAILVFSLFTYLGGVVLRYISSSMEKKLIKSTFSTYVAPEVVEEIIQHPEFAELGGQKKCITALFSDIKSFSTFSELLNDPQKLGDTLNEYLGTMSDEILKNKGLIDKYIGDSIVSMFGSPRPLEEHAYAACASAIRMKQAEAEFNKRHLITADFPAEFNQLYTRIGINTGDMTVGNFGTDNKMNFTMLGDEVNLASRLEGVNKKYDTWILCSENTWKEIEFSEHKDDIVAKKLNQVRVVGKTKPIQLYNIVGFRSEMSRIQIEEASLFDEAMALFMKKKFVEAGKLFMQANEIIPEDKTAIIFANECRKNISEGVPEDWDGIWNLTSK